MALTFTSLDSGFTSNNVNTFDSNSVSVTAGRLVAVCVMVSGSGTQDIPNISGPGTLSLEDQESFQTARTVTIAIYEVTSGGTGVFTFSHPSGTNYTSYIWSIVEIDGHDTTTPVVQKAADNANSQAMEVLLGAAVTSGNAVFGAFNSNSNVSTTPTNSGVELDDEVASGPTSSLATQYNLTPSIDGISADLASSQIWRGICFEIAPAAGGGGDTHEPALTTEELGLTDSLLVTEKKGVTDSAGVADSLLVTEQKGKTDAVGVTDTVAKTQEKDRTDDVGVTDSRLISLAKRFTDAIGITDEASITKFKLSTETPTDSVDVTEQLELTYQKGFYDFLVNTDQIHLEQSKARTSDVGITDEVTIIKSKSKTLEFLVGITDSIAITLKKTFNSLVGITDETSGTGTSEEAEPMSLVDEKRIVIGTVLGITEPTLSALSINDLLHMYWAADFPALHTYDGSESGLTPAEAFSTMDHHSRVEANEATDLDWIRGVLV